MEQHGDETHAETDGARAGSTPHIVRWILGISLLLAIVLLSVTWITGALSVDEGTGEGTATDRIADDAQDEGNDSIVSDDADEIEAAPVAEET